MNIVWIHPFLSEKNGKAPSRHIDLASDLKLMGINVTLVACVNSHMEERTLQKTFAMGHPSIRWIPGFSASNFLIHRALNVWVFALRLHLLKKNEFHQPSIVVGSSPDPMAALSAWLLAKRLRSKYVLEVRDLWPQSLTEIFNFSKFNPYVVILSIAVRFLYSKSDGFISTLENFNSALPKNARNKPHVIVPNYGSEAKNALLPRGSLAAKEKQIFRVIYTGNVGSANSMMTILEAFRIISKMSLKKDIRLDIYGSGPLLNWSKKFSSNNKLFLISFHAPISRSKLREVLMNADCGLICWLDRKIYNFGKSANKFTQYLSVGLPVICSTNHVSKTEKEGAAIITPAEDPQELATAIVRLSMSSDREIGEFKKRALSTFDRRLTFESFKTRLSDFFELLAKT